MKHAKWMLTMILVLLPGLAAAQLKNSDRLVAQVPFEFTVANKIVPAGQCEIQPVSGLGRTLLIRHFGAGVNLFAGASMDETKQAASRYSLVFNKYAGQYFLSEIKVEGSKITYRMPLNKAEAELRAQNLPVAEQIIVASLK